MICDETIRDEMTRQDATMQHNMARHWDDETTRQQNQTRWRGNERGNESGETGVGREEWGEGRGTIVEDRSTTRGEVAPAIDCCWVNDVVKNGESRFLHRGIRR
jgi:hypothetical protein